MENPELEDKLLSSPVVEKTILHIEAAVKISSHNP